MGLGVVLGIGFDLAQMLAMLDADRTRVEFTTAWGETYAYRCLPGPDGTFPEKQAEQAHAVLEASLIRLGEEGLGDIPEGEDAGRSELATGLTMMRKGDSWRRWVTAHLEREYGCLPML